MSLSDLVTSLFGGAMVPMAAPGVAHGTFRQKYHVYSPAFWESDNRDKLETGDKIVVPASALEQLSRLSVTFPIMFRITHRLFGGEAVKISHCSVLEFTADEGNVYVPMWMIDNLALDPNGRSVVELETVTLPKGNLVQFQAHETAFAELKNPRVVLENSLRMYSALTVGDTIQVAFPPDGPLRKVYKLDVTEVQPPQRKTGFPDGISIIETDIKVDFIEPKDYAEYEAKQARKREEKRALAAAEASAIQEAVDEDEEFLMGASSGSSSKSGYFDRLEMKGVSGHCIKASRKRGDRAGGSSTTTRGVTATTVGGGTVLGSSSSSSMMSSAASASSSGGVPKSPQSEVDRMPSIRGVPLGVKKPTYPMGKPAALMRGGSSTGSVGGGGLSSPGSRKKKRREEEIVGSMRYIYEIDDATGERTVIRKLPVRKAFWEESTGHSLK